MTHLKTWLATERDVMSPLFDDVLRRASSLAEGRAMSLPPVPPPPSNYKLEYSEAGAFSDAFRMVPHWVSAPEFKEVSVAFALNMERVAAMFMLAPHLVYYVARNTQISCAAAAEVGISVMDALEPALAQNEAYNEAATRIRQEERQRLIDAGIDPTAAKKEFGAAHINRLIRRHVDSISFLASDEEMRSVHVLGGVEAILFAMVANAYAAFETLAADLWEEALNAHPQLALNWCKKGNHEKSLSFQQLSAFQFDVSNAMGSILSGRAVGAPKARFDSIHDIRKEYEAAFGPDATSYWADDREIRLVAAVRNLIAHRGGLIDDEFLKYVRDVPEYASQLRGSRVYISGAMVSRHVDACTRMGIRLVGAADKWVEVNGKKN